MRFFADTYVAIIQSSNDGPGAEHNTHKGSGCEDLLLWWQAAQLQEAGDSHARAADASAHATSACTANGADNMTVMATAGCFQPTLRRRPSAKARRLTGPKERVTVPTTHPLRPNAVR